MVVILTDGMLVKEVLMVIDPTLLPGAKGGSAVMVTSYSLPGLIVFSSALNEPLALAGSGKDNRLLGLAGDMHHADRV